MNMLCDICGYNGEINSGSNYLNILDIQFGGNRVPESRSKLKGEYSICSKCRDKLIGFMDMERAKYDRH